MEIISSDTRVVRVHLRVILWLGQLGEIKCKLSES